MRETEENLAPKPSTQVSTSWRLLVLLPLIVFAGLGLLHTWSIGDRGAAVDFYQFWAVGQAVHESLVEDIYLPEAGHYMGQAFLQRAQETESPRQQAAARFRNEDKIEVASTPFLYTLFYLIQSGDFEKDIRLFRLLGLIGTVLSIVAICRMLGYPIAWILIVLAFIFWSFSPLHDDIRDGNVNQIQLTIIVLYLWLARRPRGAWQTVLAGTVLGLAIAFKPNLAPVAIVLAITWVIRRQTKTLLHQGLGLASGGLIAIASASAFFGTVSVWSAWLKALSQMNQRFDVAVDRGNFGGARLLHDWLGISVSPWLFAAAFLIVGVCVARARARPEEATRGHSEPGVAPPEQVLLVGIGTLIAFLAAGLAWSHYLVLAIPICIHLLRPRDAEKWYPWISLVILLALSSSPILQTFKIQNSYWYAIPLALASALLLALGCRELWIGVNDREIELQGGQAR